MNKINVKYTVKEGAVRPVYKTSGSAGADLFAFIPEPVVLPKGKWIVIPTGVSIELPSDCEAQVRTRSGMASKHGVSCLNSPGTIDSDYRGEIAVILVNHGEGDYTINNGDRIAQIVFSPVFKAVFEKTDILSESARGIAGFGSTGR